MTRARLAQPPLDARDFRRLMDGKLKESQWQKQVVEALETFGWVPCHIPSNVVVCPRCYTRIYRGIKKGIPDILALKPPFKLWAELKTESGRLEPEQRQFGEMLKACGDPWLLARPRDRARLFEFIAHPERGLT